MLFLYIKQCGPRQGHYFTSTTKLYLKGFLRICPSLATSLTLYVHTPNKLHYPLTQYCIMSPSCIRREREIFIYTGKLQHVPSSYCKTVQHFRAYRQTSPNFKDYPWIEPMMREMSGCVALTRTGATAVFSLFPRNAP